MRARYPLRRPWRLGLSAGQPCVFSGDVGLPRGMWPGRPSDGPSGRSFVHCRLHPSACHHPIHRRSPFRPRPDLRKSAPLELGPKTDAGHEGVRRCRLEPRPESQALQPISGGFSDRCGRPDAAPLSQAGGHPFGGREPPGMVARGRGAEARDVPAWWQQAGAGL